MGDVVTKAGVARQHNLTRESEGVRNVETREGVTHSYSRGLGGRGGREGGGSGKAAQPYSRG